MKTLIFTHLYQRPDTTAESLARLRGLLDLWLDHLRGPGKYTGDIILFTNLERIERDGLLLRPMPNVPVDQRRAHMHRILCYDLVPAGAEMEDAQTSFHVCTGVGPDLMECSRDAVRAAIAHLGDRYGLEREEAYAVTSVAADLRIHEVVDAPNWVVGAFIPEAIFEGG